MIFCKDCIHWGKEDFYGIKENVRRCNKVKVVIKNEDFNHLYFGVGNWAALASFLVTHADFACIMGEKD